MNLYLYRNNSEANVINKDLTLVSLIDGTLREQVSITRPRITIEYVPDDESETGGFSNPTEFNYFYLPDFQRYYFVTDVIVINDRLLEIGGACDVLESFKTDILYTDAIIARTSDKSAYNKKINDASAALYQDPVYMIKRGGALKSFSYTYSAGRSGYVLAVAGGVELIPPT